MSASSPMRRIGSLPGGRTLYWADRKHFVLAGVVMWCPSAGRVPLEERKAGRRHWTERLPDWLAGSGHVRLIPVPRRVIPSWLYLRRDSEYDSILRFGRRPLVYTVIRDNRLNEYSIPTTHLLQLGRLHLGYGVADGITEGLLPGMRSHLFERKNGMGLLVSWGPR